MTLAPLMLLGLLMGRESRHITGATQTGCEQLVTQDLDHLATTVYAMCDAYRESLDQTVLTALNVA